ncbi:outer membrane beta-barrel protein [Marivirga sp. S37H4]|uniref:Outer membrane beta-barrel protein n=1 Tax=Marivirga aurantiaca TaxID=2802615 RepID=A0A935C8A5_9BACT|nr:outer membrane beta-barrel protein [Marivirga aurantiaca]MBK6264837.1 outer membrane beta-barrel protein [Marivirga aurantiaca]
MKRINHIALVMALTLLSMPGMAFNETSDTLKIVKKDGETAIIILEDKIYSVRIFKHTSREELEKFKEEAAEHGIDITYENLQIVNGTIEALKMKVDCNDGFSGVVTVTDIPESGIGFIRDYSEDANVPFQIGKVFQNQPKSLSEEIEEDIEADIEEESKSWEQKVEDGFDTAFNRESKIHSDSKSKKRFRHDHEFEFLIGLNNYLNEDNQFPDNNNEVYSLDPSTSWTYGINSVHRLSLSSYFKLNFQFGLQWYNFAMADSRYQIIKGPEELEFMDTAVERPDISPSRSKLNITYLNINLVPMFHTGKSSSSFRFGAGPYGGYRIGSKSKFKYDDDGKDVTKNNFYLNNWRYGIKAQVGWKGIDLFATYDLNPLFIDNRGPELNAFSFGIIF